MNANCGHPHDWFHCYAGSHDLWVPEAYSHPAKMAAALCQRILSHLKELGLLTAEDTILDFMCGIGTTVLLGALQGNPAVGVELEPKFVDLARQNVAHVSKKVGRELNATVIQGDARNLSDLLGERGMIGITSPPFLDAQTGGGISKLMRGEGDYKLTTRMPGNVYQPSEAGTTPGQIGQLKDGPDRVVGVTSPPYEKSMDSDEDAEARSARTGGFKQGQQTLRYADNPLTYLSRDPSGLSNEQRHEIAKQKPQIGQHEGESYLSAMKLVYEQAFLCCDVLAVVTKNPTRNGKLRDLAGDTRRLLEEVGFRIHCIHRAILFEELEQGHMFEGSQKKVKGRLSFFKRLSYQKGSPVAQWEDIVICVRGGF